MKIIDILEAAELARTAPTTADIEFSKEKIQEVITALNELQKKDKWNKKSCESYFDAARKRMDLALKVHDELQSFNKIKGELDETHKAKDIEGFKRAFEELKDFLRKIGLTEMLKIAKRKSAVYFKVESAYRMKLISTLERMSRVRDSSEDWLKRAGMSDKQRAASEKASMNMRARWGSF